MNEIVSFMHGTAAVIGAVTGAAATIDRLLKRKPNKTSVGECPLKKAETVSRVKTGAEHWRMKFWRELAKHCPEMKDRKFTERHYWLYSARSGADYKFVVTRSYARVEMYIDSRSELWNCYIFDALVKHRNSICKILGENVTFERLNGKQAKRIKMEISSIDMTDQTNWSYAIEYLTGSMRKFVKTMDQYLIPAIKEAPPTTKRK